MDAEDLMRFDWVHLVDDNTPRQVDWIRSGEVGLFWNKTVTPPYLEPILLTSEILEKNGFKEDSTHNLWLLTDDYYDVIVKEWSDSIWVFRYDNTEVNIPHEQIIFSYVHSLQHAFRHCGIDKEVII